MSEKGAVRRGEAVAGAGLIAAGLAVATEALTFNVNFLTDPLGPKALPLLSAALFVFAGVGVLREAQRGPKAGATPDAASRDAASPVRVMAPTVGVLLGYSLLLVPLGFIVATPVAVALLARIFGAPWRRGAATGGLVTVLLWALFTLALSLPLPVGDLWMR